MIRIEMIGPSGVGKTTLYNRLKQTKSVNRSFLTHQEALVISAKKQRIPIRNTRVFLLNLILRLEIYKKKELGIAIRQIKLQQKKRKNFDIKFYEKHHYSFSQFIKKFEHARNPFVVYHRIGKYINRIDKLEMMRKYLSIDIPVLIDEGTSHCCNFNFDIINIQEDIDKILSDDIFHLDGIISCEQKPEIVYAQALARKNSGIKTFTHGHLTDQELKSHIYSSVSNHEKKVTFYISIGIPVLRVNTGAEFAENLKLINTFISETAGRDRSSRII